MPRAELCDRLGVLAFLHWNHRWNDFHFDDSLRRRAFAQLKQLGIRHVRTDVLWSDVHRGAGRFDFSSYDSWIPALRENGLEPLILLHYNKQRTSADGRDAWNKPPDSFEEFAGYVNATVNHFKTHVRQWEIWNEPNHPMYWDAPRDGLASYVQLLKMSREAAKDADSSCVVLNGGLTGDIVKDVAAFYDRGGGPLTDALNIHTFINPLSQSRREDFSSILNGVKDVMDRHGDAGKRIWITEMGCPGIPASRPRQTWFQGEAMDEQQQAEWLDTLCDWINDYPVVERLFWAFYRDTDGLFKDATDYLGLVRLDLSPKPAFDRLAQRIRHGK